MEIEIETTGGSFQPGGTIDVQITIRPKKGVGIRTGQVELVCTERWWEKKSRADGGDERLEVRSGLSQPLVQSFIADTELTNLEPVVRYARFQIPTDAPPTVYGSVAQVSWELTGRLDTEEGDTVTQTREITVLTPPVVQTGRSAADLTVEETFSGCILAMVLVNDVVGAGGFLEGELRARMDSTFQAREVRIELHTTESAGDRQAESIRQRVSLEKNVQLTTDRPYVWAFSVPVPDRTLPTVKGKHTKVSWHLKAVVETDEATDGFRVEREVQVFTST